MSGPVAPKDPEKDRSYFYIMKEKETFGSLQTQGEYQGRGVQFIYESDGRLESSAEVTGEVCDEEILKKLGTVEGFKSLVHSIGISVEMEHSREPVTFVFQMYGKEDLYGGGTLIETELRGDGAEVRITLDTVKWKTDDDVPGQIRFVFETPEQSARVNVRFFLKDGFFVPKPQEERVVDMESHGYQEMIERSLLSMGDAGRIRRVVEKARAGEPVTIAYIGGSITQGAGAVPLHTQCYAYRFWKAFAGKYGKNNNVKLIKAGVGGTPSELGMIRFERDVLRDGKEKPDLVVVEFAVNDEGDETKGRCYESLVTKILSMPDAPAVLLLFAVFANDWNLQERLAPVGERYQLPMVSIRDAVTPQFRQAKDRVVSKNQFFYDVFHPTNLGHKIMADCLMYLIDRAVCEPDILRRMHEKPVYGDEFAQVKLLDRRDGYERAKICCGAFSGTDQELQCVEMDDSLTPVPEFPYNWQYDGANGRSEDAFQMDIYCQSLLLIFKDSGAVDAGRADVFVDDTKVLTADPHVNGWTHCNPVILLEEKESGWHQVRIQMTPGEEEKKFTILGFGYVE